MDRNPDTVTGLLAGQRGGVAALIYRERTFTYAELDDQSRRVAGALRARGIGTGDRVGFWLPNCPAYAILYFACARLGAIAVAVNTRYRSVEVADMIGRGGCKALAYWPGFKDIDFAAILNAVDPAAFARLRTLIAYGEDGATAHGANIAGIETVGFDALTSAAPLGDEAATPDSPCNIFTTSGTTKAPKFVLHKQSVIVRHACDVAHAFGYDADDARLLQAIPLCGVFGFSQFMATIAGGAPCVMMPAFGAEEAVRLIRAHRVTHTVGADDMADRLIAACAGPRPLPSLRHFGYAKFNAALFDIVERADARGITLCGLYGSSEMQALFSCQPSGAPIERRRLAGGTPVSPQAEVRARDTETGAILPHGAAGELEISAPSGFVRYDGDVAATREALTGDGFFRTGDLGYTSQDGSFVYLCRAGDVLRLGGFLVNPAEIEAHLLSHAAVDGCQVVGAETRRGTVAFAFVTLKPSADVDDSALRSHCSGALAVYKVPARVCVIDAFPVTQSANGIKIQRGKLRRMAQARIDARAASSGSV